MHWLLVFFKSLFVGSVGYPGLKFCTVIKKVLIKLPLQIMELQDQFYQEIQGALVLHKYALWLVNSRHSLNQSYVKPKPIAMWSLGFSRASVHFTLRFQWLLVIFFLYLIGPCDNLVVRQPIKKRAPEQLFGERHWFGNEMVWMSRIVSLATKTPSMKEQNKQTNEQTKDVFCYPIAVLCHALTSF